MRLSILQAFLIGAAATVLLAMTVLALSLSTRISATVTNAAAADTAMLITALIAPAVQELAGSRRLTDSSVETLDRSLEILQKSQVPSVKIWLRDGTIVYATNKSLVGKRFTSQQLDDAFAGKVVAGHDDLSDRENDHERTLEIPLMEVYAPIYRTGTSEIIAVGEFYKDARVLSDEIRQIQHISIALVMAITAPMLVALFALAIRASSVADRHRRSLEDSVDTARKLADQNDDLRRAADEARLESIQSNERLLQQIGQDLHDGPIQTLSLLALRLSSPTDTKSNESRTPAPNSAPQQPYDLATRVLKELRDISTGLVLPELKGLSTSEAIWHAVREHEFATQTRVQCHLSELPDDIPTSLKICLYRIVQEGLSNAFHHAEGRGQRIEARADHGSIRIVVGDKGQTSPSDQAFKRERKHLPLGLSGLRRRVELMHGEMEFVNSNSGSEIRARIPVVRH